MSNDKKYGLIVPDKTKLQNPIFQASRNVFGDDSESEDDLNNKPVLLRPSDNINRQAKIAQNKAISEDPSVYLYDEVYDDMKSKKEEKLDKKKIDKKPRYIENLLKSAQKRKIENERRIERQIQKERENEGNEFADKEIFVTSAYKKKLEELKLEEEREKREEYLEQIGDVTKQSDLGGFYRHLYEQKLGTENKKELKTQENEKPNDLEVINEGKTCLTPVSPKKRNYRKRKSSNETKSQLSEGEIEDSDEEINRLNLDDIKMAKKSKHSKENLDSDSDFSIDESSDDDVSTRKKEKNTVNKNSDSDENTVKVNTNILPPIESNASTDTVLNQPKPKIDIWKKRTVGEVFEQALKRYYERKASRGV